MSAQGNKAKANKNKPKDPTPKRASSTDRLPVRSPIDDGMRSQMFNLSPALQYRRRDSSPLVPGLQDPPRKKRKAKVSSDDTPAFAADIVSSSAEDIVSSTSAVDKSSSAEDTASFTSAVNKSSSAEDTASFASAANKSSSAEDKSSSAEGTAFPPLGIRISNAVDMRLQQLNSSKTPEKEHSALESDKGPSSASANTPLEPLKSPKPGLSWGDEVDPEDDNSSDPPKIAGEKSKSPRSHQAGFVTLFVGRTTVTSEMPSELSPCVTTDSEDDKAPSTDKKGSPEHIRKGGAPKDIELLDRLAKNLAEETRRTKSPPGTPNHRELDGEVSLRKARESLGKLTSLVSSVMSNTNLTVTADPNSIPLPPLKGGSFITSLRSEQQLSSIALGSLNESLQRIANDDDLMNNAEFQAAASFFDGNTGASTEEDRVRYSAFLDQAQQDLDKEDDQIDEHIEDAQMQDDFLQEENAETDRIIEDAEGKGPKVYVDETNLSDSEDGEDDEEDEEDESESSSSSDASSSTEHISDRLEGIARQEAFLLELHDRSKLGLLDTVEDMRVAFHTLLDEDVNGKAVMYIPHSFSIHLAHMFFQRTDPFNVMVKNYEAKQNEMMVKQVERFNKELEYLQQKLRDNLREDTQVMVKYMKDDNDAKESELFNLKADLKRLTLQHAMIVSDHEMLTNKVSDTNEDTLNYEVYQTQIDDWRNRCSVKKAETELLSKQVANLKAVILEQGLTMPPSEPVRTAAPAPAAASAPASTDPIGTEEFGTPGTGWQFTGANRAVNRPNWGNAQPPQEPFNNGWGTSPSPAPQDSSHGYSDSSVEPQFRGKGKNFGKGNNPNRGINIRGRGNKHLTQPSNKRGRDSRDDSARDVRQKAWNQDGKSIAEAWSKQPHIRLYVRTLTLGAVKSLLISLRSADLNFQKHSKDVPIDKWHENSDTALAHLHKALGMPVRFTVSPHFYYRAAQWPCKNAINMLLNNERSDREYRDLFTTRNPNEFDENFSTMPTPVNILELGDTKACLDYKIAKFYLALQEANSRSYTLRRLHFYKVTLVRYESRPNRTFLHKDLHIKLRTKYKQVPSDVPTAEFNRSFDEAFKNYYTNIMQEIEGFIAYQTPLQYTLNFTTDIRNLYYYNDDCTSVRDEV